MVVSHWPVMVEVVVHSQATPHVICGGRSGSVRGLSLHISAYTVNIILPVFHIYILFVINTVYCTIFVEA
jgi:hypothetical protein